MSSAKTTGILHASFGMFSRYDFILNFYPSPPYSLVILYIFKDATLFFSRATPSIATVIPAMDHINEHLSTAAIGNKYSPAIKAALAISKKTLNRYYNKTNQSEVYRITMGMTFKFISIIIFLIYC